MKRTSNSRQSISSGVSIPASIENVATFEDYLTMAQDTPPPTIAPPPPAKGQKKPSKYGIHVQRNKEAVKKLATNFVEQNKQAKPEPPREQRRPSTWRNLIKGVLDLQRGKIPLLLAVEAGNQSMVRELLSAQTAEQLQVSSFMVDSLKVILMRFIGRQRLKMAIQRCTWPPDDATSIWCVFWWITVRMWTCRMVKVKRLYTFVRARVTRRWWNTSMVYAPRHLSQTIWIERQCTWPQVFITHFSWIFKCLFMGSHNNGLFIVLNNRKWTCFGDRTFVRQIQSEHLGTDKRRQHIDAHRIAERPRRVRHDAI